MGYANITPQSISGNRFSGGGSSFLAVGGAGYSLNDFRIEGAGGEYGEADTISFIQPGIAKVDNAMSFYWDNDYQAWAYALSAGGHSESDPVEAEVLAQVIPSGTGFLCDFKTSTAKIVYAGEVNAGTDGKITCGRGTGRFVFIVNPNPYEITLADMKIVNAGGEYGEADTISFIQPGIAKVDNARCYYFDSDYNNWAYALSAGGHSEGDEVEDASAIKIKAGEAFLFDSKTEAARVVVAAPKL